MMDRLLFALAFFSVGFMVGITLTPANSLVGTIPPIMEPYAQISDLTTQSCDDSHIGIIFTGAGTEPATPSIIVSVAKVS